MISVDNAEPYTWGAGCDGWHLVKQVELSVIRECMPPGPAEARHQHQTARQFFFVLSGAATMELAGRREVLGPGQGLEVPPRVPHQIFNDTADDLEFLVISQPASHGDRVLLTE